MSLSPRMFLSTAALNMSIEHNSQMLVMVHNSPPDELLVSVEEKLVYPCGELARGDPPIPDFVQQGVEDVKERLLPEVIPLCLVWVIGQ